jgi:dTDP-4-amino-4,6-dideoxygalactose transaminase
MIPFNTPYVGKLEQHYIKSFLEDGSKSYHDSCIEMLSDQSCMRHILLTHSCTASLELALLALDIGPGDEIILPSFTYVSTANAVVLRGATPVFVDIEYTTKVIDPLLIEQAITANTRAIILVHYSGVTCDIDLVKKIAEAHSLLLIEDAAQSFGAFYNDSRQGYIGDIGCLSFHRTKNIHCFTGGALIVNPDTVDISSLKKIYSCGTDRDLFYQGFVNKYSWQCVGSNFEMSALSSAFLYAQLQNAQHILEERMNIWTKYNQRFTHELKNASVGLPFIPNYCIHNAHIYYLVFHDEVIAEKFIAIMRQAGVECTRHYTPLHQSRPGLLYGRTCGDLTVTEAICNTIVRLPNWVGLGKLQDQIIDATLTAIGRID